MKKSSGGGYLKKNITTCEIAHKYGSYEGNIHDYGICYAKQKYIKYGCSNTTPYRILLNKVFVWRFSL